LKRILTATLAAALVLSSLSLTACEAPHRLQHKQVAVKHLSDGRWVYQDTATNNWFLYEVLIDGHAEAYTGDTAPVVGGSYEGGTISVTETSTISEADLAGAVETSIDISVDAEGSPATASEVSEASSDSSSGDSSSSSDGGSSGGDSGGGGDGGGGGGGDGGGGGE
jgi:hypothetical protein